MRSNDLDKLGCSPRPAFLWDVTRGRIVWANAAAVRLFGALSLADLVERPFGKRDEGVRALAQAYERLRQMPGDSGPADTSLEVDLRFLSIGRDKAFRGRIVPHTLPDGRPGLLVQALEPDAAEASASGMFFEILHGMPQPVLAFTLQGAPVFANPAATELLGEDAGLACAFTRPELQDFLARAQEAGLAVATREVETPIGRRTLRLVARAGRADGLVVVTIDDLTDRLRLEHGRVAGLPRAEASASPAEPEFSPMPSETAQEMHEAAITPEEEGATPPPATGLKKEELATLRRIMHALENAPGLSPRSSERTATESAPAEVGSKPADSKGAAVPSSPDEEAAENRKTTQGETPSAREKGAPASTRDVGERVQIRIGAPSIPEGEPFRPASAEAHERPAETAPATAQTDARQAASARPETSAEAGVAGADEIPDEAEGEQAGFTSSSEAEAAADMARQTAEPPATEDVSPGTEDMTSPEIPERSIPAGEPGARSSGRPRVSIRMTQKARPAVPEARETPGQTPEQARRGGTRELPASSAEEPPAIGEPEKRERPQAREGGGETPHGAAAHGAATAEMPPSETIERRQEQEEEEHPPRQRPEPPAMVRDVLDHRPEPIILHRSGSFYYANRAARELFGFPADDEAWDEMARKLAASADDAEVELADAGGGVHRFRLQRDIFPWREGMVVQSTLLPPSAAKYRQRRSSTDEVAGRQEADGSAPSTSTAPAASDARQPLADNGPAAQPGTSPTGGLGDAAERNADSGLSDTSMTFSGSMARRAPAPVIRIHTERGAGMKKEVRAEPATETEADTQATPDADWGGSLTSDTPVRILRALLETAADGFAILDGEGKVISLSARAERLLGVSTGEVAGRPFRDLLAKEFHPAVDMHLKVLQATADDRRLSREQQCDAVALAGHGGRIPLCLVFGRLPRLGETSAAEGSEATRPRPAFSVALHDITRFRQRERELERARDEAERRSARKSEFLARISHELRTPLNAILGFAEVLHQEMFGELGHEKYRAYARDIQKSGELLLSLVNDLLDLARIEAGRYELGPEEVDLREVLEDTVNLLRDQINKAGVELRRVVPDNLPKVVADARSMKQILINLLSNAIKFSGRNGRIVVALRQCPDGGLELAVKDSGPGMTREELQAALEPYRRVPRTGGGLPGSGLGLPLAKALAEANKARFEIDSEPGQGTEVRIIFPPHRVLA